MKRKSSFIGMKREIVHGQEVLVKCFDCPFEPSLDVQALLDEVSGASPNRVAEIHKRFLQTKYVLLKLHNSGSEKILHLLMVLYVSLIYSFNSYFLMTANISIRNGKTFLFFCLLIRCYGLLCRCP